MTAVLDACVLLVSRCHTALTLISLWISLVTQRLSADDIGGDMVVMDGGMSWSPPPFY
ncbi:hypothetical protein [Prochlorococcus marinus]|uniref:hypothetical protein n=1 Tax=Prochlorococcus marinus TaxID=1219 RepID=UPI0012DAA17E|nr:hypothetical protein [Prochlorococcus marinus]